MEKRVTATGTAVALFLLSLLLSAATVSMAATVVVAFGGAVGFKYSPSDFNCSVGDTIKWEGSFSSHPLSSTAIPPGAATWHASTGSVFSYEVKVAGTYQYKCDFHAGSGMVGQFTASATAVEEKTSTDIPESFGLDQNFPNPFNPKTMIRFSLPETRHVVITIYNELGNKVVTLVNGSEASGSHTVVFDGSTLPSGIYYYRMEAGDFFAVKKLTLIK
jgi:plastocyanin